VTVSSIADEIKPNVEAPPQEQSAPETNFLAKAATAQPASPFLKFAVDHGDNDPAVSNRERKKERLL
jgi:hypothetical protein